ncbi:MAG: hypothetical protein KAT14_06265 [Candidatus Marinimicrobia bacterium]|nr:hypothetical protein [Candidatus Neomarinimicrobiota bacterium]
MRSSSMIYQLLKAASNTETEKIGERLSVSPDCAVLSHTSFDAVSRAMTTEQCALKTLAINNHLPLKDGPSPESISTIQAKGVRYYAPGRAGMPALVVAEEGLAVPGSIIAGTDKNLLELGVLGSYVIHTDPKEMAALLNSGSMEIPVPASFDIVLEGEPGEWVNGIDIALFILKYYELPDDTSTCLEIYGDGLNRLSLPERFNMVRVLVDFGYEHVLCQVDEQVIAFLQDRSTAEGKFYFPDTEKQPTSATTIDLHSIHPMLAWKNDNIVHIGNLTDKDGVPVHQVFIGGDTACRFKDFETGLKLVRYRPLFESVSAYILPGSQLINSDLLNMGIASIFTEIGVDILPPAFLDSLATYPDTLWTRMGTSAQILQSGGMLANALSCFSAAMTGKIIHPLELESILKQENSHKD